MDKIKVIITGTTGMVGEGVLLECLQNDKVEKVLIINRRHYDLSHPKLQELLVPDFMKLENYAAQLSGYDACFFCAGVTSIGKKEPEYTQLTYDLTLYFAKVVLQANPGMVFTYVSGQGTDSSEKGRLMWARVKGKTENDLMKLGFSGEYNFRPGVMVHFKEQQNVKGYFKPMIWILKKLFPASTLTLQQVGRAMIHAVTKGYTKSVLEVKDIKDLAGN
ncbi:MAG TPA: NAD-dependent epimerase/dehydratase family protein [Saprospiraceae bacterium]|nr:NAD-dependent epimerase/dehydratase family protein [Saprospiraceae bacterium]